MPVGEARPEYPAQPAAPSLANWLRSGLLAGVLPGGGWSKLPWEPKVAAYLGPVSSGSSRRGWGRGSCLLANQWDVDSENGREAGPLLPLPPEAAGAWTQVSSGPSHLPTLPSWLPRQTVSLGRKQAKLQGPSLHPSLAYLDLVRQGRGQALLIPAAHGRRPGAPCSSGRRFQG